MSETLPIVVLASCQVLPKHLGVEIGLDGGFGAAGAATAAASDGSHRFPRPGSDPKSSFCEEEVGAVGGERELQSRRHGWKPEEAGAR